MSLVVLVTGQLFKEKRMKKSQKKIAKVMREFEEGKLHSGSKRGQIVGSRRQAVAIAISEAKKKGKKITRKRG